MAGPEVREGLVGLLERIGRGLYDDIHRGGKTQEIEAVLSCEIGDGNQ
jgi:hypothetical protein